MNLDEKCELAACLDMTLDEFTAAVNSVGPIIEGVIRLKFTSARATTAALALIYAKIAAEHHNDRSGEHPLKVASKLVLQVDHLMDLLHTGEESD